MARKKDSPSGDVVKKQIIDAVIKIVTKKGFAGTKISDISKEVGLTKGALYWYFKNKDELFHELMNYIRNELIEALREISNNRELSPMEKLNGVFNFAYTKSVDNLHMCILPLKMLVEFNGNNSQFENILREVYGEFIQIIESILEEGKSKGMFNKNINSWDFAMRIVGTLDGILQQFILHGYLNGKQECRDGMFFPNLIKSLMA